MSQRSVATAERVRSSSRPSPSRTSPTVLHEKVIQLSERFEAARVWLMVDSVTYAIAHLEVERSVAAATYSNAIGVIAAPTLSLAHTGPRRTMTPSIRSAASSGPTEPA